MLDYTEIHPLMEIKAAGRYTFFGTAQGNLLVLVCDAQDVRRNVRLPKVPVPGLGRSLFLTSLAAQKGVNTILPKAIGFIVDLGSSSP